MVVCQELMRVWRSSSILKTKYRNRTEIVASILNLLKMVQAGRTAVEKGGWKS
jgi:hypothetical protein